MNRRRVLLRFVALAWVSVLVMSAAGCGVAQGVFATATPTPTLTSTPTSTFTPTNTPGGAGKGLDLGGVDPTTTDPIQLLQLQDKMQKESAFFNTMSNVSKTEHETRMAAIRNMKS